MNPYLRKLRGLTQENHHLSEPSKPSKPSFDGFEGEQSNHECYRHAVAALRSKCPELVEPDRWQRAIRDANSFLAKWGAEAHTLGWTARELFGLHAVPERPAATYKRLSRYDETGLIWLLHGRPVVALTDTEAVILARSGASLTYRRSNEPALRRSAVSTLGPAHAS
jgi:hypothetical protein